MHLTWFPASTATKVFPCQDITCSAPRASSLLLIHPYTIPFALTGSSLGPDRAQNKKASASHEIFSLLESLYPENLHTSQSLPHQGTCCFGQSQGRDLYELVTLCTNPIGKLLVVFGFVKGGPDLAHAPVSIENLWMGTLASG